MKRKKEYAREYYRRKGRSDWLNKTYGITQEDYDILLESQDFNCAICKSPIPAKDTRVNYFMIDHDHKTGFIRGLLCRPCNLSLGTIERYIDQVNTYLKTKGSFVSNLCLRQALQKFSQSSPTTFSLPSQTVTEPTSR